MEPPPPTLGYAAMPPAPPDAPDAMGRLYDAESDLYLPGGTELASRGRRVGAYFLAIPLSIVTLIIGYIIWGLIVWGKGTTPALQVLGMRCYLPQENRVPGFGKMALREVVGRWIIESIIWIIGVISFFVFLTDKRRQPFHDKVAGTVVLYDPQKRLPRP
jgi:uncharacterized RDD family membrane protein YckC